MSNLNYDQVVKSLLKAKSQSDIDAVLENADLLDCKTIIRTLLARYNHMMMQGAIESVVAKKNQSETDTLKFANKEAEEYYYKRKAVHDKRKHAHWNAHYECSNCGESVRTLQIECPFCHSIMDEEV